jgi:hypothetical protein
MTVSASLRSFSSCTIKNSVAELKGPRKSMADRHGAAMEYFQSWMAVCFTVSIPIKHFRHFRCRRFHFGDQDDNHLHYLMSVKKIIFKNSPIKKIKKMFGQATHMPFGYLHNQSSLDKTKDIDI